MTARSRAKRLRARAKAMPRWDKDLRELWLGDVLVKRFRVPAPNQERILASFQEQRWRAVIDDPLPVCEKIDGVTRLQFTIKRLNSCQKARIIRFFGTGTGQAIGWRLVAV